MSQDGFLFDELSDFKKDILRNIAKVYPEEAKDFIKTEAKKVLKITKKIARKQVGTSKGKKKKWVETKSYHKRFKVGKPYKYAENDLCVRAFNSSRHGHMIEYGHIQTDHDKNPTGHFVLGNFIFKQAEIEFLTQYLNDCEEFMGKFVENTVKGIK